MTNKEFFLKRFEDEIPAFERVLKAIPNQNLDWTAHDKNRTASDLLGTIAMEPAMSAGIVTTGAIDFSQGHGTMPKMTPDEAVAMFMKNAQMLKDAVMAISDENWENQIAKASGGPEVWEEKMYTMIWILFFDLVHHRGQLSTYIRPMGGKVPSIYGPSGDMGM